MKLNPVSSALLLLLTVPIPAHAAEHGRGWAAFGRQGFICVHGRSVPNACQDAITASVRLSTQQNRPPRQQQPTVQASKQPNVPPLGGDINRVAQDRSNEPGQPRDAGAPPRP